MKLTISWFIIVLFPVFIFTSCRNWNKKQKSIDKKYVVRQGKLRDENYCIPIIIDNSLYIQCLNNICRSINVNINKKGPLLNNNKYPDSINVRNGCLRIAVDDYRDPNAQYFLVWDGKINYASGSVPHVNLLLHSQVPLPPDFDPNVEHLISLVGISFYLHYDLSEIKEKVAGHKVILNLKVSNTSDKYTEYQVEYIK